MFEVGFTEIIVILGIALLVLGPERLPKLAADVGRWMGRARAMARQLRTQLEDEVHRAENQFSRPEPAYTPPPPVTAPTEPMPVATADNPVAPPEAPVELPSYAAAAERYAAAAEPPDPVPEMLAAPAQEQAQEQTERPVAEPSKQQQLFP